MVVPTLQRSSGRHPAPTTRGGSRLKRQAAAAAASASGTIGRRAATTTATSAFRIPRLPTGVTAVSLAVTSLLVWLVWTWTTLYQYSVVERTGNSRGGGSAGPAGARPRRPAFRRFPLYGTSEFNDVCSWTVNAELSTPPPPPGSKRECQILVRPSMDNRAGISEWMSQITSGKILSAQTGCKLLIDYGFDQMRVPVEVTAVLIPPRHRGTMARDWTVPFGYECLAWRKHGRCSIAPTGLLSGPYLEMTSDNLLPGKKKEVGPIPWYRTAYFEQRESFIRDFGPQGSLAKLLTDALPGFELETGMACALGSTVQLSPATSFFETGVHGMLIPKLRDERSLTMAVYVRTGQHDGPDDKYLDIADLSTNWWPEIECAVQLEKQLLQKDAGTFAYSRVTWMVVTDSPQLRRSIVDTYHGKEANAPPSYNEERNRQRWFHQYRDPEVLRRRVLSTSSSGKPTRIRDEPTTKDFAEAMIDWFLLGESDLVILRKPHTFGATAALRTARPVYEAERCKLDPLFPAKLEWYERERFTNDHVQSGEFDEHRPRTDINGEPIGESVI